MMAASQPSPTGIVTFLFTDIESSTQLWERHGDGMRPVLARHDALLRAAVGDQSGHVVKTTGDGLLAAFASPAAALLAALAAQRALAAEAWSDIAPDTVRVRMGLHCGEAEHRDGDYFGTTLNRAARVMALGHGGQILLSAPVATLLQDALPSRTSLRDLGEQPLRGLSRDERVFQLVAPDLPAEFPPLHGGSAVSGNLPLLPTSFVGRAREMAAVKDALAQTRLLTLTGPGGTGKTRLSLQVAAEVQDGYSHGAWLVELAPVTDPELVVTAVAGVFNLRGQTGAQTSEILVDYLREKELLLILDNCEHLIDACARLAADLIAVCPQLTILASSREGLNVYGEQTFHLPTLSLPAETAVSAAEIGRSEAVQLFVARAAQVRQGFTLDAANATGVAQIVRRLDGIPLALELAAARLGFLTVEQIAARLDDRFRILTGGSRTALPRQQTLRALIDWSYDLLQEEERQLFRKLAVFVGGWALDAAESVAAPLDVWALLPQLHAKSLVVSVDEAPPESWPDAESAPEPRYTFLETIRQYARDRLIESGEVMDARDRHFDYYEQVAYSVGFGGGPTTYTPDGRRILRERENLRAAVEWGTDRYTVRVLELIWNLFPILGDTELGAQAVDWVDDALRQLETGSDPADEADNVALRASRAQRRGLVALTLLLMFNGQLDRAAQAVDRALVVLRQEEPDPLALALALYAKAQIGMFYDDPATGANAAESADLFAQAGQQTMGKTLQAQSLLIAATSYRRNGELELAERAFAESEAVVQSIKGDDFPWFAYIRLMILLNRDVAPHSETERAVRETVGLLRRNGSSRMAAMAESDWGHRLRHSGDLDGALAIYQTVLGDWRTLGHRAAMANILENIAFVDRAQGRFRRAAALLGAASRIRAEAGQDMLQHEREEYEREVAALRLALPPNELEESWAEGRALSGDALIALAQQPVSPPAG